MRRHLVAAAVAAATLAGPALPQEVVTLGRGTLLNNDLIGDGRDRWRTGSYVLSIARGTEWTGQAPERPFALREWRLKGEVIAPGRLTAPAAGDRRYAGIASLGVHTHVARAGWQVAAGADLVAVGPMTQIGAIQSGIHDAFGLPSPAAARRLELPNALYPTLLVEAARPFALGSATMRPFVEAQAGVETFARVGFDLSWGGFGRSDLVVRDTVTGQRYRATKTESPTGLSFVLGGDIAHVASSALLPDGGAAVLNPTRTRLRAGFHWQGERAELFYGITRMGREFQAQPVEQTVGSIHLRIKF